MDELIKQASLGNAIGGGFMLWELFAALGLAFFLNLIVVYFYRETHRGLSYSVSFVQTFVLMGATVSVIMLIIGSNIARAFALVGALSIIRYRTAVKDARDTAFIFIAMAIGMACGTGFYVAAIIFTVSISAMIYILDRFDVGSATKQEVLLRLHLPENLDHQNVFNEVFYKYLQDHSLVSVETIRGGALLELVYTIQFKKDANEVELLSKLREINGNNKVLLLTGKEGVNV